MRHIPDDELHAYLDQALSRSQAVEIERHLARCPSCQSHRDGIAALRDRTTDLLARLGSPPSVVPPPFEELRARYLAGRARRMRWLRAGALAAGLGGLVLAGRLLLPAGPLRVEAAMSAPPVIAVVPVVDSIRPSPSTLAASPSSTSVLPRRPPADRAASRSLVRTGAPAQEPEEAGSFAFARAIEGDSAGLPDEPVHPAPHAVVASAPMQDAEVSARPVAVESGLSGLWRTIGVDRDNPPSADLPIVPGLTVVGVRMQPGAAGAQVMAVDQLLETGEVVRTISGPAARVGTLLAQEAQAEAVNGRVTFTIRQDDRMVAVTGPAEALSSLLSRVNGRRRY